MTYNDEFGYHEVIHTAHVFACTWDNHILGHGVVDVDEPELKKLANKICELMNDFYNLASLKSDEKFHGEKDGN